MQWEAFHACSKYFLHNITCSLHGSDGIGDGLGGHGGGGGGQGLPSHLAKDGKYTNIVSDIKKQTHSVRYQQNIIYQTNLMPGVKSYRVIAILSLHLSFHLSFHWASMDFKPIYLDNRQRASMHSQSTIPPISYSPQLRQNPTLSIESTVLPSVAIFGWSFAIVESQAICSGLLLGSNGTVCHTLSVMLKETWHLNWFPYAQFPP